MNFNIKLNLQSTLLIILLINLGVLLWNSFKKDEPKKQYWEKPNFKPLKKKLDKTLKEVDSVKFDRQIPPLKVYHLNNQTIKNKKVVTKNDSLIKVVDSLRGVIANINKDYLKQYPKASKLIKGYFSKDSIRLDLLDIEGNTKRNLVETDFQNYSYGFKNNSFQVKELDKDKELSEESFLSASRLDLGGQLGYRLIKKNPFIGLNANYSYGRFNWDNNLNIDSETNVELRSKIIYNFE